MRPLPNNTGTLVALGGVETFPFRKKLRTVGAKNVSFSFASYKLKVKKREYSKLIPALNAFPYILATPNGKSIPLVLEKREIDLPEYLYQYREFCQQLKDVLSVVAIYDNLKEINKDVMYLEALKLKNSGLRVCPTVYSHKDAVQYHILENYEMIGIPYGIPRNEAIKIYNFARKAGVLVHGFSRAAIENFNPNIFQFYSVNTSNWMGSRAFGNTYVHTTGRVRTFNVKNKLKARMRLFPLCQKYGLDLDLILEDKSQEVVQLPREVSDEIDLLSIAAFVEFQEELSRRKYYWVGEIWEK